MPGPGANIPGFTAGRQAPPAPVAKPRISVPDLPASATVTTPPAVNAAWRNLWHALGSNLPWYINHSRRSRRALRGFLATHG